MWPKGVIGYYRLDQRNDDPSQLLFGNSIERFGVQRNFGKFGTVSYSQENREFDGTQTQQSDSRSQTLAYEAKITGSTAVTRPLAGRRTWGPSGPSSRWSTRR